MIVAVICTALFGAGCLFMLLLWRMCNLNFQDGYKAGYNQAMKEEMQKRAAEAIGMQKNLDAFKQNLPSFQNHDEWIERKPLGFDVESVAE